MKLKLFVVWMMVVSTQVIAQKTIIVNNSKPYPVTSTFQFICNKYAYSGELHVQIAKTEKGGILKLSIAIPQDIMRISGRVYVDLADGDVIACADRKLNETEEKLTTSYYYFTPAEFNKLKQTDIKAIRFIISGGVNTFGNQEGYFTAQNKINYFSSMLDKTTNSFNTAEEISNL
jgi:hypothetical protein